MEQPKLESMRLKNFKAFADVEINHLPKFAVFVGANGAGKSTIFSVFGFLKDALNGNVNTALSKLGGSRGLREIRSRGRDNEPIEIELKFKEGSDSPLITYFLSINETAAGFAYVEKEQLKYRRGSKGQPWLFLNFANGEGDAVENELDRVKDPKDLQRERQTLKAKDILAVKGLAQFEKFPAVKTLGNLIENWHVSDFHITHARQYQDAGYAAHLSREGENLSLVIQYLYQNHRTVFDRIRENLKNRIPGIDNIDAKTTEEGKVLLKFQDAAFAEPFLSKFVSDGTMKMLAYLVLLYDPAPYPLLCVEEPENQLYHSLLAELAEEFRAYAHRGNQVFVSTHSPDFLNAVELDEVFWLEKVKGYTQVRRAGEVPQIRAYMENGDKMGYLWEQGFFAGVAP
ncbi:MAG: AAA family ATPase [Planctomycetota bacterium]|jgi:predicted ATPase|nr:AAA family ATPase [Planctomycetota bacterium]